MSSPVDFAALLEDFIEDASGHLEQIEAGLLELDRSVASGVFDKQTVIGILGNLHTIKGNSGMMGFIPLQQYLHQLESALKLVQEKKVQLTTAAVETFLAAVSSIRSGLAKLSSDPGAQLDFSDEMMLLEVKFFSLSNKAAEQYDSAETLIPPAPVRSDDLAYITQKTGTLKVAFEKLDELLNLVGELVIHRTALTNLERRLQQVVSDRAILEDFSEVGQLINKSSSDLREAIMKARMLPVESVFRKFHRLVRDHSRKSGKEIQLEFEGQETELDKTVIDEISEPLLHLIRNAVDHGVESAGERRAAGKPSAGTIRLKACYESNHIVISVEDDGRGIDPEKIRLKAVEKGLISESQGAAMPDYETLQMIFLPGFSTSSEVTETSGRGIGLDVVKKIVTSLSGMVDISSQAGTGTCFTIKLPLTLAIINALMVDVGGETFAIPLSGVMESVRISNAEIHQIAGGEVINLRERLLPIRRLDLFFGMCQQERPEQEYVVIVGSGEKRGGLVVDRLLGQQEIVIKALDDYLGELPGISGGTVLGDGTVSLIIDISSILGNLGGQSENRHEQNI